MNEDEFFLSAKIYLHIVSIDLVCNYLKSIYSEQTLDAATER